MSAIKIFFGNYKGGVGKTTSTYNLAVQMAAQGKKILIVDLDPQSSLSEVCLRNVGKQLDGLDNDVLNYVYDIYMQAKEIGNVRVKVNSKNIVRHTNGISFIPNTLFYRHGGLDKFCMDIGNDAEYLLVLRDFMEENGLTEQYDFIFFDCPPSNNIITQSAFLYSDYYIIPTIMDPLSINGVSHYISVIENIYRKYCGEEDNGVRKNAEVFKLLFGDMPKLLGIFETMRKGNTNTQEYRQRLVVEGYYIFENEVKDIKEVSENMGRGQESSGPQYRVLATEILGRIEKMEAERHG